MRQKRMIFLIIVILAAAVAILTILHLTDDRIVE